MAASNNQVGPGVNAKTIAFDKPGAGVIGYGINDRNLYPKLTKLYGARADKAGGSKAIWDAMVNNTNRSLTRSQSPIALEFQNFLNTGKMPANPTPQFQKYAAESLDYGLRETGRAQQHKPVNFFTEYLMDPLIQTGLGMIPGVGVPLAMAYGGIKGVVDDGIMGGLTGLASGYGAGTFGSTIGNTVASTGGLAASAANPGTFGRNLLTNLNPFSSAGSTLNNHFANNAGGFFSGGGVFGSTAGRGVANAGTAINAAGRTSGTGFSGFGPATGGFGGGVGSAIGNGLNTVGGAAGTGGGKMGAFSEFMNPVKGFLNNFDYGSGNLLGDIFQGGLSYYGNQRASNQLDDAANRAFANSQFQPYNINTPGGSATFNGQNASATLSPEAQRLLGNYNTTMGQNLTAFNKFSPQKHSQEMYRTLSNLRAPGVTQQNNNLLSDVYNRGQWGGTVGAQDIYSADMANNLQDQALRMQSQEAGGRESNRLFTNYMQSAAAYHSLLNSPNQFIAAGLQGGQARSNANSAASEYPWLAAGADYGSSNAFWSSIGQSLNNMSQQSANNSANSNTVRNNYQNNFYQPQALGLTPGY